MADREELLRLAERCEAVMDGDRDLEHDIAALFGEVRCVYPPGSIQAAEGLWTVAYRAPHPYAGMKEPVPRYTRSLDAAVKLVPEGWNRRLSEDDNGLWWAELRHGYETSFDAVAYSTKAATPALALCAAALRAHAAQAERG